MSKEPIEELSDGQMSDMFAKIGRAKEDTARSIMKKQEEANEIKRHQIGTFFGNSAGNAFGEDVDLDEMERRINAELEIARRGIVSDKHQPIGLDKTTKRNLQEDMFNIDDLILSIENSANQPTEIPNLEEPPEPELESSLEFEIEIEDEQIPKESLEIDIAVEDEIKTEIEFEIELDNEELLDKPLEDVPKEINEEYTLAAEKEDKLDNSDSLIEQEEDSKTIDEELNLLSEDTELLEILDIVAPEKDKGYFSIIKDVNSGKVGYAFVITLQDGRRLVCGDSRLGQDASIAAFDGVLKLFDIIEQERLTAFILCADSDTCKLLKRNATYGIVDGYSESCVKYIARTKEISEKCYLRITDYALDQTPQYMALAATTANALVCGINK